ncbi:hypothetical protein C8R44DRAFT_813508 [Mycena epipterygia]|nr:hypothetical protein C8R44DRAFT_813508 [Mycena epipterygia]
MPFDMDNGWSRFHSSSVNGVLQRTIWRGTDWGCWLSQANYVFSQLPTALNYEDCFLVHQIIYQLSFSDPSQTLPEGYLLLCPLEDLRANDATWLANPECAAYWSLDPSGSQRLSAEEASRLGFPSLELKMAVPMQSWDGSVYTALGRFHAAKGFDPNSQDIARHLGYPLYELCCAPNMASACIEEVSSDPLAAWEDPVSASHDAPHRQRFRFLVFGILGLILALVVSWLYSYLRVRGERAPTGVGF